MRTCKHCAASLVPHIGGEKDGMWHCDFCGCCFNADARTLRDGHPGCAETRSDAADDAVAPVVVSSDAEDDEAAPAPAQRPRRRTRRDDNDGDD